MHNCTLPALYIYWYTVEWANDFDSTYICIWSNMNKSLNHYVLRHKCYFLSKNDMFFNDIMSQPNISKFYLQISINEPMFDMHFTTGMAYIADVEYFWFIKSISTANVEEIYCCLLKLSNAEYNHAVLPKLYNRY